MKLKPISTAPRDGTNILLRIDDRIMEGWFERTTRQWKVFSLDYHGYIVGRGGSNSDPDAWCELPTEEDR